MSAKPNGNMDYNMDDDSELNGAENFGDGQKKINEYCRSVLAEKLALDKEKLPISHKLLDCELIKTQAQNKKKNQKFMDIYHDRPTMVISKVLVPVKEFPKFNFVGKLLGPRGSNLKKLQEETMCRMTILGRGSMRDANKEEELRKSLDLKHAHLSDELHVEISALGPPSEAYARIAFALSEIQKCLVPDDVDDVPEMYERRPPAFRGRPGPRGGGPPRRPGMSGPQKPPAALLATPRMSGPPRRMPEKPNTMPLFNRNRAAMDDSYNDEYDDSYEQEPSYSNASRSGYGGNRFGASEYDEDYFDEPPKFSENQRWRPYKASEPAQLETPRYRSTPYSRPRK